MTFQRLRLFPIQLPSFEGEDAGGAPAGSAGNDIFQAPSGGSSSGSATSGAPAEPSVIDVDENALIRIKGQDKPVKFGDYSRGFQSQFTKASQEAARLKQALQEREQRLAAFERQQQQQAQAQPQQNQPSGDMLSDLRQLPYLDGKQAASVIEGISDQIKQRDTVLLATLKEMQRLQNVVNGLHGNHVSQSFESKIDNWLKQGNYAPELKNVAKEIYLAYEGDNLDQEFPQIFANRVKELKAAFEAERRAALQSSARQPFVPGRGGQTGPSKPLSIPANATSAQIADALWPGNFPGSDT